jgi:3-oxoacyl-(acyl-carrier-protein) synthase
VNVELARRQAVVTGAGAVCGACDASPFVRMRKLRKFMGRQDELAVVAAARALKSASLAAPLGERCGLYLAVGYIPFDAVDIEQLLDASLDAGRFSMQRFASNAFGAINPLLTFRVLPNMPAFHVSLNFDLQGPYVVSYPGAGQFYCVLEEALAALDSGAVDMALVGAVADQQNVLVEHHFSRVTPPVDAGRLANAAAFLVMERTRDASARGASPRAHLIDFQLTYAPVDPFAGATPSECLARDGVCVRAERELGPASLGVILAQTDYGRVTHQLRTRDGFAAASTWEVV